MVISVLVVDDVPELRHLVRTALRFRGGFEVVAEAANGEEAVAAATAHAPNVVVLDLGLPDLAGREVLHGLRAASPTSKIVVFTGLDAADADIAPADVDGFVRKEAHLDYLVDLLEHLARSEARRATLIVPADPAAIRAARRFAEVQLTEWGWASSDDAVLVISELVTNAVTHAASGCELRLALGDVALRIDVEDSGEGMPDPLAPDEESEHGRGLFLVSSLAKAWGVEVLAGGNKVVWAELPLPSAV